MQKIKHERQLVRVKSETIMGQVYPWVGLDCVGLGQKFSTFNESGCDGSNCKKRAEVYQYTLLLHICTVCFVFLGLVLFAGKYGTIQGLIFLLITF